MQPECTGRPMQVKVSLNGWKKKSNTKTVAIFSYPCRSWMTDAAVDASRPVVGSSRNKTDGDIINSIPILVRFRSPPEIPRMNSFPTCHRKSEISKGQGCVFTCFFCKQMWLHFASLSHYFTKIEGIICSYKLVHFLALSALFWGRPFNWQKFWT